MLLSPTIPLKVDLPMSSLPITFRLDNAFLSCSWPLVALATAQWTANTWRAQYRTWRRNGGKGAFVPAMPRKMQVLNYMIGESCASIRQRIRDYGVSSQLLMLTWDLWPDGMGVGLNCDFLVPGPQAWMADVILRWGEGDTYAIMTPPVYDRERGSSVAYAARSQPWQPWGVPAKARSWDETICNMIFGAVAGRSNVERRRGKKLVKQTRRKRR
jgi:hypothetical protein